ncbi:hypothetical protein [Magnetovibrio blakemorei]|uniref:Uncharacterized protein n=1 Tax=Magnetovibrio blakemorei TaxID=28181 RepID=A0A1E5Q4A4_9PROT|nr:hypothetical protein [Magnetovibrio blakemorei]OEJ64662.1 hypothetical protein BEN30_00795 [Magnetovibrio blakemorei]
MSFVRTPQTSVRSRKGTGGFLLDADTGKMRDPITVKQWMVLWTYQGQDFALKGTFDFIADLATVFREREHEYFWLKVREFPQSAYWKNPPLGVFCKVELLPCTKHFPATLYMRASNTARAFDSKNFWRFWDDFYDQDGMGGLPDNFEMRRLRS